MWQTVLLCSRTISVLIYAKVINTAMEIYLYETVNIMYKINEIFYISYIKVQSNIQHKWVDWVVPWSWVIQQ